MPYSPLQLAEAFIKAGEIEDAYDALCEHLADFPNDGEARRLRADVALRLDRRDAVKSALEDLDTLTDLTPMDSHTRSVILERLGRLEDALDALADTADDPHESSILLERRLNLLRKLGRLEEALSLALENDWIQWAADTAAALQDDERALDYYNEAIARTERLFEKTSEEIAVNIRARVLMKRGAVYHRLERLEEADADYLAALEAIPDDPGILFNRGLVAALRGETDIALVLCTDALEAAPNALRPNMLDEVRNNPRYQSLQRLLNNDT